MKYLGLILCICGFAATTQALEVLIDEPSAVVEALDETSAETEADVSENTDATEPAEESSPALNDDKTDNILEAADIAAIDELIQSGFDVNSRDENGLTPLVYVLKNNADLTVAQKLIDAGADVNAPCLDGTTPLLVAVSTAQDMDNDYQQILVQTHSTETETYQDRFNKAAEVQMQRAQAMLQLLINAGADVNQETPRGTPLMAAAANARNTALIDILLQNDTRINQTDQRGRTALFYAHAFGNEDIETQLIKAGALTDIRDRSGQIYMDAQKNDFLPRDTAD
jgi:ankyrin repeat protein